MIFEDIANLYRWTLSLNFEQQYTLFTVLLIPLIIYWIGKIQKQEKELDILIDTYERGRANTNKQNS